jgi:AcrR family transcriptional regulator
MSEADVRMRIMSGAKAAFSRYGYHDVHVSHILDEAGIARATFYKYFPNKRQVFHDIIAGIFRLLYDSVGDMLRDGDPETLGVRLRDSLELSYGIFLDNRGVVQVYLSEAFRLDPGLYAIWDDFERRTLRLFAEVLDKGIDSGAFRVVDTALVSRAMFMLFLQVPFWDVLLGSLVEIDTGSLANEMVKFVMFGISAES